MSDDNDRVNEEADSAIKKQAEEAISAIKKQAEDDAEAVTKQYEIDRESAIKQKIDIVQLTNIWKKVYVDEVELREEMTKRVDNEIAKDNKKKQKNEDKQDKKDYKKRQKEIKTQQRIADILDKTGVGRLGRVIKNSRVGKKIDEFNKNGSFKKKISDLKTKKDNIKTKINNSKLSKSMSKIFGSVLAKFFTMTLFLKLILSPAGMMVIAFLSAWFKNKVYVPYIKPVINFFKKTFEKMVKSIDKISIAIGDIFVAIGDQLQNFNKTRKFGMTLETIGKGLIKDSSIGAVDSNPYRILENIQGDDKTRFSRLPKTYSKQIFEMNRTANQKIDSINSSRNTTKEEKQQLIDEIHNTLSIQVIKLVTLTEDMIDENKRFNETLTSTIMENYGFDASHVYTPTLNNPSINNKMSIYMNNVDIPSTDYLQYQKELRFHHTDVDDY